MMKCSRQPVAGRGQQSGGVVRVYVSAQVAAGHCDIAGARQNWLRVWVNSCRCCCVRGGVVGKRRWMCTAGQAAVGRLASDSTNILAPVVTQVQAPMLDTRVPQEGARQGRTLLETD